MSSFNFQGVNSLFVGQVHELAEWFGFETRNKYRIRDNNQNLIGYAAEQQKGIFGFFLRQFLGHWRSFDVHFFTSDRQLVMVGHHPFRWYFERIEVRDSSGKFLGAIQRRFSIFTKRFFVEDENGMTTMEVSSPIWRLWTFKFVRQGVQLAKIQKKWGGIFFEGFTDKDKFLVEYESPILKESEKRVLLVSAVFIDLLYFETKN